MRLVAWCIMPTHWHMIVWPGQGGGMARFFGWLTLTHAQRWHAHRHTTGQKRVLTPVRSPPFRSMALVPLQDNTADNSGQSGGKNPWLEQGW
jgi:hypothetical protein